MFFFQAEDGIRDRNVTGVQTCALPILGDVLSLIEKAESTIDEKAAMSLERKMRTQSFTLEDYLEQMKQLSDMEIGRASCRERVKTWGDDGRLKRSKKTLQQENTRREYN